jgi:RNA polymerase sigma factor (sigma-70 family)
VTKARSVAVLRRCIRRIKETGLGSNGTDQALLERFVAHRDEEAFAQLVRRHGAMVLAVCRRVLNDPDAAQDVFQATFLVLARKAAGIAKRGSVGSWLYGVAYRLAQKARSNLARRCVNEKRAAAATSAPTVDDLNWREMRAVLDEELQRLPEKYRAALVLCYLQERTRDEAAQQLGWPLRTLKYRLELGRDLLRRRLVRRGFTLGAGLFVADLLSELAPALAGSLVDTTAQAAVQFLDNSLAATSVSGAAILLARGELHAMLIGKLKVIALLVLMSGLAVGAVGMPTHPQVAAHEAAAVKSLPESVWTDLASADEVKVARAILALSTAEQKSAVAFLQQRLYPVRADFKRMDRLIADLDSGQLVQRQKAAEELEYLGGFAIPRLRRALSGADAFEWSHFEGQVLHELLTTAKNRTSTDSIWVELFADTKNAENKKTATSAETADTRKAKTAKEPQPDSWKDAVAKGSFSGTPPLEVVRRIEEVLERMTHPQTKLLKEKEQVVGEKERLKEQVAELEKELSETESAKKALEEKVAALIARMREAKDAAARRDAEAKLADLLRKSDDPVLLKLAEFLSKTDDRSATAALWMVHRARLAKLRYTITAVDVNTQDKNAADLKEGSEIVNNTLPPPAWLRAARAVAVLENIATPEARQLLESLAAGERDALPTREAKAALERLNKPVLPQ